MKLTYEPWAVDILTNHLPWLLLSVVAFTSPPLLLQGAQSWTLGYFTVKLISENKKTYILTLFCVVSFFLSQGSNRSHLLTRHTQQGCTASSNLGHGETSTDIFQRRITHTFKNWQLCPWKEGTKEVALWHYSLALKQGGISWETIKRQHVSLKYFKTLTCEVYSLQNTVNLDPVKFSVGIDIESSLLFYLTRTF